MVVNSSAALNIGTLFRTYVTRSTQYLLTRIQQSTSALSLDEQEQTFLSLGFALELASEWSIMRDLLFTIAPKMEQAGHRKKWMGYLQRGIRQSKQLGDIEALAELQVHVGVLYLYQALYNEAHRQFSSSATLFEQLGKPYHQARALNRLAAVARRQHDFDQAKHLISVALGLLGEANEEVAYSYSVLGAVALDQREWQDANHFFSKSLVLSEESNNPRQIAWGLTNLGTTWRILERYDEAIACYQRAINLFEAIQDPVHQAVARMNLGNVYLALERFSEALELYQLAESTFHDTDSRLRLARLNLNKGIAYEKLGQWEQAKRVYLASIEQWEQIGTISSLVNAMNRLGTVYLKQGLYHDARSILQDALNKLAEIKHEPSYKHLFDLINTDLEEIERGFLEKRAA